LVIGMLVGNNQGTINHSFWNTENTELDVGVGGDEASQEGVTGKTTTEMKQQSTFTNWDFTNTWKIGENTSYPTFKIEEEIHEPPTAIQPSNFEETEAGTEANPYQIASLGNLIWLSETSAHWDKHFHTKLQV